MKTLKPVDVSDFYIKQIASGMAQYFWGYIFAPIFDILIDKTIDNSVDDLIKAIKSGRIWYENGAFRTKNRFSNNVSKTLEEMGAKYFRNAFYIEPNKLSAELLGIINLTNMSAVDKATKISELLTALTPLLETLTVRDFIEVAVDKMYKKLELDILKSAQEFKLPVIELGIASPDVRISKTERRRIESYWKERDEQAQRLTDKISKAQSPEQKQELREKLKKYNVETYKNAPILDVDIDKCELNKVSKEIANDYVYNMNYWIKKWEVKNIVEMRKEVADMVQKGVRVPQLQEYFEKRWKIAKSKALFLAENESRLAGSVIQATQYQKLGCTQFKWGRSTSIEKRKLHKEYYGQVFRFDDPPIIDEKLGIRGLPRQIWNCKCQMLCVVPSLAQTIKRTEEIRNAKRNVVKYIEYKVKNNKQRSDSAWRYRQFGQRQAF